MSLDVTKLKKVSHRASGKIVAQCPACAAAGNDGRGEHLAVFPDGRFGCVVHPQDNTHNKEIFKLVGVMETVIPTKPFEVHRLVPPKSKPKMDLGRFSIHRLKWEEPKSVDIPAVVRPLSVEYVLPPVKQPQAQPPVETLEANSDERKEVVEPAVRVYPPDYLSELPENIRDFLLKPREVVWVKA